MWETLFGGLGTVANVGSWLDSRRRSKAYTAQQADFARNSVQYRVADARKAGIHPLYALGAPTISSSAMVGQPSSLGNDLVHMGQSIDATKSKKMQAQAAVENLALTRAQKHYWMEMARKVDLENARKDPMDARYKLFRKFDANKGQMSPRPSKDVTKKGDKLLTPTGTVKIKPGETKANVGEDLYGDSYDSVFSPYFYINRYRMWRDFLRR